MKDAKGHGSDPRGGAHSSGVESVGRQVTVSPKVLETIRNSPGGFSITPDGQQPTNGYMVSIPGHSQIVSESDLAGPRGKDIMDSYAKTHSDALSQPGAHFGGWTDKEAGKTYLDVSQNIPKLATAYSLGVNRNQIAIWDVAGSKEIPTGGRGMERGDDYGRGVPKNWGQGGK